MSPFTAWIMLKGLRDNGPARARAKRDRGKLAEAWRPSKAARLIYPGMPAIRKTTL